MQTLLRCRAAHLGRHRSASYSLRRYVADLRAATAPAVTDTTIARKRVFGVAAHIDAGKTTTCEAILHAAGALSRARMGRVDAGDTMLDYLPAERARGITISAASAAFVWGGHQIFLVDSPGHLDFTFEVERALAVMDAVVVLVDAVAGVQAQTETVWRQADRAGLARMLVVNKCDRDGARVVKVVAEARARFGVRAPVMQMAVGYPGGFEGVLDLVSMQMRAGEANGAAKLDERQMDTAREMRSELVECVAEVDDGVMQLWMDEHPVPPDVLRAAVRSAVARRELVPVFCAAALKDVGVREVMDAAVEYLPSPAERSPVTGTDDRGKRVEVSADAGGDVFVAQAFKVTHDRHRGRLVHFRAFAGALEDRKLPVWNVNTETKERPSKWLRVLADEFEEVGRVECGDVFAMVGLRNTSTGDTISSTPSGRPSSNIRLPSMEVPPAVCSVALETESPSSQGTLDEFLARQLAEDPSLRLTTDAATGETLMSGVGELHLEAVTDRIAAEVDAEVRASRPRVAYRESVGKSARHVEHYDARIGSAHLVASLRVAVEPREEGGVTVAGDGWSREQATAIREGVSAALGRGVLCGLPTRGVAAVVDRPPDAPDASDAGLVALRACAAAATQKAMQAASPRVLEPMMRVKVVVPESFGGDIAAALSHPARCRGIVDDVSPARHAGFVCIQATAPLAGMMGFATQMRSVCKGRGDVSMVFNGYAPVPTSVADRLRDGLQH